jgi:uncharacterized protein
MINILIRKESKIHGFGIFAIRDINKGEIFYQIPTNSISNKSKSRYAFIGNDQWVNDPIVLNRVNHSCEPNTKLEIIEGKPVLISKRKIVDGEEITCDYNKTEKGGNKVSCKCRSKKCKGYFIRID